MRNWLRAWLGINLAKERADLALRQIHDIELLIAEVNKKSNDLSAALQEMRELREMVADPKKIPIPTRNSRQFRALVEQETSNGL